jgi:alpha-tubulin suppressor-like RCC1 family protein
MATQPNPSRESLLVTWGRSIHGECGHGRREREDISAPTPIESVNGRPVTALTCGHYHSAAVIASAVHTWGRGTLGLLGHGDEEDVLRPRPVHALSGIHVRAVSCGTYQTAAVTERGELFVWGWLMVEGETGWQEGYTTLPERVAALKEHHVRSVSCGEYATAAVTKDGSLFTWGKGTSGQLGHGHARDVTQPLRVGALGRTFVWDARFGKHFLLVLSSDGDVYSCGSAERGVLGHGSSAW